MSTPELLGQIADAGLQEEKTVTAEKIKGSIKDSEVQTKSKGINKQKRREKEDR